ncbi:MAG: ribonuclease VapC, partial [Pseudonocardiales bacterium]|nr:ribonuclease VapC [Pseudonocardiales bacterium]
MIGFAEQMTLRAYGHRASDAALPVERRADFAIRSLVQPWDFDLLRATFDAVTAARLWDRGRPPGLSLGDRCCLALAERVGCAAVTADTAW